MALSHSSSADSISDVHGPGTDDTHNISQWREVQPGEEIPFEFEAREKLRHRYRSESHSLNTHMLIKLLFSLAIITFNIRLKRDWSLLNMSTTPQLLSKTRQLLLVAVTPQ